MALAVIRAVASMPGFFVQSGYAAHGARRERMEQARQRFRETKERISKLEAEIERLKADR